MRGREREHGGGPTYPGQPRRNFASPERRHERGGSEFNSDGSGEWSEVRNRRRKVRRQVERGSDSRRKDYYRRNEMVNWNRQSLRNCRNHRSPSLMSRFDFHDGRSQVQEYTGKYERCWNFGDDRLRFWNYDDRLQEMDGDACFVRPWLQRKRTHPREVDGLDDNKLFFSNSNVNTCEFPNKVSKPQCLDNSLYPSVVGDGLDLNPTRYVSYYFTNFPDDLSLVQLRKGFEVCGILEDVYVAKKRNVHGNAFGFVKFSKVRDVDKLLKALNDVWFGHYRVRARVALFNRNDSNDTRSLGLVKKAEPSTVRAGDRLVCKESQGKVRKSKEVAIPAAEGGGKPYPIFQETDVADG